jgi:hypothetical protein
MNKYSESLKGQAAIKKAVGIKDITNTNEEIIDCMNKAKSLDQAQELFTAAFDLLHSSGSNGQTMADIFAFALQMEHRTHQQSIVRTLFNALRTYGNESGTDARNETAVTWAKKSTEEITYFPYI